jgi:hypothetical protein
VTRRQAHVAERFAIDFVQIDPLGRLFEDPLDPSCR